MAHNTPHFGRSGRTVQEPVVGGSSCVVERGGDGGRILHDTFKNMVVEDSSDVAAGSPRAVPVQKPTSVLVPQVKPPRVISPAREGNLSRCSAAKELTQLPTGHVHAGTRLSPASLLALQGLSATGLSTSSSAAVEQEFQRPVVAGIPVSCGESASIGQELRKTSSERRRRKRSEQKAEESGLVQQLRQQVTAKDQEIATLRAMYQEQAARLQLFQTESSAEMEALRKRMSEFELLFQVHSGPSLNVGSPSLGAEDTSRGSTDEQEERSSPESAKTSMDTGAGGNSAVSAAGPLPAPMGSGPVRPDGTCSPPRTPPITTAWRIPVQRADAAHSTSSVTIATAQPSCPATSSSLVPSTPRQALAGAPRPGLSACVVPADGVRRLRSAEPPEARIVSLASAAAERLPATVVSSSSATELQLPPQSPRNVASKVPWGSIVSPRDMLRAFGGGALLEAPGRQPHTSLHRSHSTSQAFLAGGSVTSAARASLQSPQPLPSPRGGAVPGGSSVTFLPAAGEAVTTAVQGLATQSRSDRASRGHLPAGSVVRAWAPQVTHASGARPSIPSSVPRLGVRALAGR